MDKEFKQYILEATGSTEMFEIEKIQDLWSGYGTIKRYGLKGSGAETVIVKHVCPPNEHNHPRGWNSNISHRRKLKSYRVETSWYRDWSKKCSKSCRVPLVFGLQSDKDEFFIALEDLDAAGFPGRLRTVELKQMQACLKWLAHFHASFLGQSPRDLWEIGTYWHYATRPDELKVLKDKELKSAAKAIDKVLNECRYKTIVHGDAKLANFCFSDDNKSVAAVDFQYVGGGCGMKDVAYFIGSCLHEEDCETLEAPLLDYYFQVLGAVVATKYKDLDVRDIEKEWRRLYYFAWADFHRFIKGWSPGHWKINSYSERITRQVLESL
jgi:hypothetical protein